MPHISSVPELSQEESRPCDVVVLFHEGAQDGIEAGDMERINQHSFYVFGQSLQKLQRSGDVRPVDIFIDVWSARGAVENLLNGKPMPIGVSTEAARELSQTLAAIQDEYFFEPAQPGKERDIKWPSETDAAIPAWRWSLVTTALNKFETVFAAEMAEATTYYIPQKGIFHTPGLIDRADDSFPADLKPFVPEKTKVDWRAAGRCLALSLWTASGFHVARAVEGTLEAYYQRFLNKPGETKAGWHEYLKELEELPEGTAPAPDEKALAAIRRMKDDYRNPVAHPRVVLEEADARMLFDMGESVIICMAQGLKETAEGPQGALALLLGDAGGKSAKGAEG